MVGQLNVISTIGSSQKTNGKKINWAKVCLFLSVLERPVGENEIVKEFQRYGMTKSSFRRTVQRHNCIERVKNTIYRHNDLTHEVGHLKGGVYKENVLQSRVKKILPSWFRPDLEFEVHGVVLSSPKDVLVCDKTRYEKIPYEWKYCNVLVQIDNGHVTVIQQPKYRDHKFGLNKERYLEFKEFVDGILFQNFQYKINLRLIRFDLHQDDHTQKYNKKGGRIEAVAGVLGLQEYPVVRKDKADFPIRRREINLWNEEGVGLAPVMQEVLFRSAAELEKSYYEIKLNKTTAESQKFLNKLVADLLPALHEVVKEISSNVTLVNNVLAELYHQIDR